MIGAVRDIDPCTGHHFDDTRRYVENAGLSANALADIQEHNARAIYPRMDARLTQQLG
jgi:4-oxalmesaconate hydratase